MTTFESLIAELAAATGLPLQIDARESCSLETDNGGRPVRERGFYESVIVGTIQIRGHALAFGRGVVMSPCREGR